MDALAHFPSDIDPPSWIAHSAAETEAPQMVSCANGLFDLPQRKLVEHTPSLFNLVSVPFDYDPEAGEPTVWLEFLASLWPDDPDSIMLLQEYFGYVLSGRTDMHKMLALIGPIRGGKGTIARTLTGLVGKGNVAGPTLASLGTNFGLSPLLGKPLAIISDARLGSAPSHTVVERLLSITGEDMLTIDRKYREPYSGRLPTRFVMLSNELPRFTDSSGAIATRMLILQLTKSFLNREDRTIECRLVPEHAGDLELGAGGPGPAHRQRAVHGARVIGGGRHHDDGPGLAGVGVRAGAVRAGAGQDRRHRRPVCHLEDVDRIERASRRSKDHLRQVSACGGAGVGQSRHLRRRQAGARLPGNRAPRRTRLPE